MLYRASSRLCVPDVCYIVAPTPDIHHSSSEQRNERNKHRLNCVRLWGALAGTQSKASPITEHDGWSWLIKIGKQLHHVMHNKKVAMNNKDHNTAVRSSSLEQTCCNAIYVMLRQSCAALIIRFGWSMVKDALMAFQHIITNEIPVSSLESGDTQIIVPLLQNTQTGN